MNKFLSILSVATLIILFSSCSKMYLSKGKEDFNNLKYIDAIESLERSVEKKPNAEASAYLARAYALTNQPIAANVEFAKIESEPMFTDSLRLEYAYSLLSAEKYGKAKEIAEGVYSRDPGNAIAQSIKLSANRVNNMKRDSSLYSISPMSISELSTSLSAVPYKNGLLVSGEKANLKVQDNYTGLSYLDLYYVKYNGATVEKLKISDSKFHDGMAVLDKKAEVMYLTRTNLNAADNLAFNTNNISNPQLYSSKKDPQSGEWSKPEKLSFNNPDYIYAHPAITEDGYTMYFSSNLSGGNGGMDLYKTTRSGDDWTTPVNLGPIINTPGDEAFPTLKDDKTLYFSSDSHQTLGGLDVLSTEMVNGSWEDPIHLSYPLNSSADDFGVVYKSKDSGYLTSDRSGADKIYTFKQFFPEISISGAVVDSETKQPVSDIKITLKNLTDGTEEIVSSDVNGKFNFELLPNKEYELVTEDLNDPQLFFNQNKKISTMGITEKEIFDMSIDLERIKNITVLPDIYWDYNKWNVRPDAEPYLDLVLNLLKANPKLQVVIRSHCDSRGSKKFNRDLSKKRAKAVMDYLIAKGIERNRLTSKGLGEKELLNRCADGVACSEAEHQENRRSDFKVTDENGDEIDLEKNLLN